MSVTETLQVPAFSDIALCLVRPQPSREAT